MICHKTQERKEIEAKIIKTRKPPHVTVVVGCRWRWWWWWWLLRRIYLANICHLFGTLKQLVRHKCVPQSLKSICEWCVWVYKCVLTTWELCKLEVIKKENHKKKLHIQNKGNLIIFLLILPWINVPIHIHIHNFVWDYVRQTFYDEKEKLKETSNQLLFDGFHQNEHEH